MKIVVTSINGQYQKLQTEVVLLDSSLYVYISSPIIEGNVILGHDHIKYYIENISNVFNHEDICFGISNKLNESDDIDSMSVNEDYTTYIKSSKYAPINYKFRIKKTDLFKPLQEYRIRQFTIIVLFSLLLSIVVISLKNRLRYVYYRESAFMKEIIEEKTRDMNILLTTVNNNNKMLEESEKKLIQSINTKDRFFSIIGHDLIAPFSAIEGFVKIILERDLPKEQIRDYLNRVYLNAENTHKLLENLLTWARSQQGEIDFLPIHFNLKEEIDAIIAVLNQQANVKSITLRNNCSEKFDVFADRNMLNTIIRNLISNSIKFTNENGEVGIDVCKEKQQNIITISDNGVGMSSEKTLKLFNVSESISTLGTQKEKGTGLGLILCKEFVDKHNGTILVESEIGKGSVFTITIPFDITI